MNKSLRFTIIFLTLLAGIFLLFESAQAYSDEYVENNWFCKDTQYTGSGNCTYRFYPVPYSTGSSPSSYNLQYFEMSFTGHLDGHGGFGPAGGKGAVSGCLSNSSAMWTGSCWNWVDEDGNGNVGDGDADLEGGGSIGDDFNPAYKYAIFDFYVNDANWTQVNMKTTGRGVQIVDFNTNDSSVNVGQSFNITWENDWSDYQTLTFSPSNLVSCNQSGNVNNYGTSSCTATGAGTVTVTLKANGPTGTGTGSGFKTLTNTLSITIAQPPPDAFNIELDNVYYHLSHCDYDVDWNSVNNAVNYEVFKREGPSGSFVSQGTTTSTAMTVHADAWENNYFKADAIGPTGLRTTSNTVNGICSAPTVDLKGRPGTSGSYTNGPITVAYNGTAQLNWTTSNTTSCTASNAWSGSKTYTGGTQTFNNLTTSGTYTLTCANQGGNTSPDSVVINVGPPPPPTVDMTCTGSGSPQGPCTIPWNTSSTLGWTVGGLVTSCTASGDWNGSKSISGGSEPTGNLTQVKTYSYTLTCTGPGGTVPDTANVVVSAPVPTASNISAVAPDYCVSGPAVTVNWTYSDPAGSPQSAFQVQVDSEGSFNSPEVDSGKVNSNSSSYFTGQGYLQFNTTHNIRVKVWNGYDQVSNWINMSGTFRTPNYAYPQVNFTWTANGISENPSPPLTKPVQFTDQTVFQGNPVQQGWNWAFGNGGSSTQQNPSYTYNAEGTYYVTLTATDSQNQTCSRTRGPLIIQKPIPKWREVAPQ